MDDMDDRKIAQRIAWIKYLPEANPRWLGMPEAEALDERIAEAQKHLDALQRDALALIHRVYERASRDWTSEEIERARDVADRDGGEK